MNLATNWFANSPDRVALKNRHTFSATLLYRENSAKIPMVSILPKKCPVTLPTCLYPTQSNRSN
jgi:hypothetical protein